MNIDEPGEEDITDEDFYAGFDENSFYDLDADDILDPDINQNYADMECGRQSTGQPCLQRMVVVDPTRNSPTFSCEENRVSRQSS